jgi:hypothetical protein
MWRQLSQIALVLSLAAFAAPASHASPSMCVGHERCGITRGHALPVHAPSPSNPLTGPGHDHSGKTRNETGPLVGVVPMRPDGSQHGGISPPRRKTAATESRTAP